MRLQRAATTTGVLQDPDGKPIRSATLRARRDGKTVGYARTDSEGRFQLTMAPGELADLVFNGDRFEIRGGSIRQFMVPLVARAVGIRAGSRDVVVEARPDEALRSLSVRVLDPDGKPVNGIFVRVEGTESGLSTWHDGWAHFHNLSDKETTVEARDNRVQRRPYVDPPAQRVRPAGQEVVLRMGAARTIEGVIEGPDGNRLSGAKIEALVDGKPVATAVAFGQPTFRLVFDAKLERIDEVRATLPVGGVAHAATAREVAAGTRDLVLRLQPK